MIVHQVWNDVFPIVVAARHAAMDKDYRGSSMRMMLAIGRQDDVGIVVHQGRHIIQAEM